MIDLYVRSTFLSGIRYLFINKKGVPIVDSIISLSENNILKTDGKEIQLDGDLKLNADRYILPYVQTEYDKFEFHQFLIYLDEDKFVDKLFSRLGWTMLDSTVLGVL